jgi:prophage regulatory protein
MNDRLLKVREVMAKVQLSRQWIYKLMLKGEFPRPIKVGKMRARWRESDIERWIEGGGVASKPSLDGARLKAVDHAALAREGLDRVKRSGNRRGIYAEIARDWNLRGVKTPTGLAWTKDTARRLILARGGKA